MIYYRCDLCGNEQELHKVEPTKYDPCAEGYRLPTKVASRVEGVKEICAQCSETVMAEQKRILDQALIESEQAMFEAVIKLWTSNNGLPKKTP